MGRISVITVGASAGGVEALRDLVSHLPEHFAAAVLVVMHVPASLPSHLPAILRSVGPLPATHAQDGEAIRPGHIYVAPPDRHLLVTPGVVQIGRGPRENHSRPAINPLFRSAAEVYGPGVAGVQLSGMLDDGVAGLVAIKSAGGIAIAQDPNEALWPSMPQAAIRVIPDLDHVLPVCKIAALLARLAAPAAHPIEMGKVS